MFQFDSLQAFLTMGGHGAYVWSAYLISAGLLVWLVVRPLRRRSLLLKSIAQQVARSAGNRQVD